MNKMENFQILAMTDNNTTGRAQKVAVIVKNDDLLAGKQRFYAMRENVIYNPYNAFKPENIDKGHSLPADTQDNYFALVDAATQVFNHLKQSLSANTNSSIDKEREEELQSIIFERNKKIVQLRDEIATLQNSSPKQDQTTILENLINKAAENLKAIEENQPKVIVVKINKETRYISGVFHEEFETVLQLIAGNQPVFLTGGAGTGKSEMCKQIADALGLDYYFSSTITQEYKLTGFTDANGRFHDTQFFKAFQNGGLYFLDEIDASTPDVLINLNGALAQKEFDFPEETIKAHKDFRVIAAGNTNGSGATDQFNGRSKIDASTIDRFWMVKIGYSPAIEREIANNDMQLLNFVWALRAASEQTDISIVVSYRSISRLYEFQDKFEMPKLLEMALVKGLAKDDLNMLVRNVSLTSENKFYKGLKELAAS
jgi:cobaltochelatase CobS